MHTEDWGARIEFPKIGIKLYDEIYFTHCTAINVLSLNSREIYSLTFSELVIKLVETPVAEDIKSIYFTGKFTTP